MNELQILGVSAIMSTVGWLLVARWYVFPALQRSSLRRALTPLLLVHSFRFIGLTFLITGVVAEELPREFSVPAAYGDLATAVLALVALLALRLRWPVALAFVWVFNIFGFIDLVNAPYQALTNGATPSKMGATFYIPIVIVPALLVSHVVIFILLVGKSRKHEVNTRGAESTSTNLS